MKKKSKFRFNKLPNRSQIFRLVENFETCKDGGQRILLTPWHSIRSIVINNFESRIQQRFQVKDGHLIGWLVVLFYGVSALFWSFNAELNFKQFNLV